MIIDLSPQELTTIKESLQYSKQRITDTQGTPREVRKENLERIENVSCKIRDALRGERIG